jgi:uncharacterized tellurite resistance protein B-like protein
MSIASLTEDQQIALVALFKTVAMADGEVSGGETTQIDKIAVALGNETYRRLLDQAESRFRGVEDLKRFLATIDDDAARNLIYGTVWEESMADPAREASESELLDWLAATWNIKTR